MTDTFVPQAHPSGQRVRTRVAPSPTGLLHLGTARTALYSWAYARHFGGDFIVRIEDTDEARSTQAAVDQIMAALSWLDLACDEGPIFQMQRMDRYREVIAQLLASGHAYLCYCTPQELDAMREAQKARGDKPRYDGTWRPEPGKTLAAIPAGVAPVVRFRTPVGGSVAWTDLVKGDIRFANEELDDLIIARPISAEALAQAGSRPDTAALIGTPTYNFCVVVDDWDMGITHVIRGDDHVNNTPRQIHIFNALGAPLPVFGHLPMILGQDGEKLSKRHGAVGVNQYEALGFLPEAMLNYLARLGWSHGDEELFTREQLVQWFDGTHLSRSAAQWDPAKLAWVNAHWMKQADDGRLAQLVRAHWQEPTADGASGAGDSTSLDDATLARACALFKDRSATTRELAESLQLFTAPINTAADAWQAAWAQHKGSDAKPALLALADALEALAPEQWQAESIQQALKASLQMHGLKMPQLAIPLRLLVCGRPQTPSVDQTLSLFAQKKVVERLRNVKNVV